MKHIDYRISGDRKKYRIDRYDIVLCRNDKNEAWKQDVYWGTDDKSRKHICLRGEYKFCIPSCTITKHLKGTTEEFDRFIEL